MKAISEALAPYLGAVKAAVLIAIALGLFYAGMRVQAAGELKRQVDAISSALEGERSLQDAINASTSDYINGLQKKAEAARALPKITLDHDCTVPAAVGGVLNDAQGVHADAGAESGAGAAGPAVDSTCAAELDIAKRNYAEVCVPNAEQLTELQRQWNLVRDAINKQ
jgi:hypothetical protein